MLFYSVSKQKPSASSKDYAMKEIRAREHIVLNLEDIFSAPFLLVLLHYSGKYSNTDRTFMIMSFTNASHSISKN